MLKLFLTGGGVAEEGSQVYVYVSQHQKKGKIHFYYPNFGIFTF